MDAQMDILKRVANDSNGSSAISASEPSAFLGRKSKMGWSRNWPIVGVAM